ncbi:MAG: PEGA domain-containing protein [Nanoarchaeota archaeon]|nr:PEGA domain-containing protein [Nanoarchaeota archaeon]
MKLPIAVKISISMILLVSFTGCATMFHGSTQTITMRSNYDDVKFYVNEAYVGAGSAVSVFKKKKNYSIRASRPGYEDVTIAATKSFDATTLLGILLDWGIISILCVDGIGTGAIQQFDQETYVIDPTIAKTDFKTQ